MIAIVIVNEYTIFTFKLFIHFQLHDNDCIKRPEYNIFFHNQASWTAE